MGWRVVRLLALSHDGTPRVGALPVKPSMFTSSAQIMLARLMGSISSQPTDINADLTLGGAKNAGLGCSRYDRHYLEWATRLFSLRDTWPSAAWMVALFQETQNEMI